MLSKFFTPLLLIGSEISNKDFKSENIRPEILSDILFPIWQFRSTKKLIFQA